MLRNEERKKSKKLWKKKENVFLVVSDTSN